MRDLQELVHELAAAAVMAGPTDLSALSELHTRLQEVAIHVRQLPALEIGALGDVAGRADSAGKLVERIILNEATDAAGSLQSVGQTIGDLQRMVEAARAPQENGLETPAGHEVAAEPTLNPDDVPLVMEFITEAAGHLESAEAQLLRLEDEPHNLDAINAIFRSFHTIKGVAGFLNLQQIGTLAHAAENLLDLARHGLLNLTPGVVDLVLRAIDLMKVLLTSLNASAKQGVAMAQEESLSPLLHALHACAAGEPETPKAPAPFLAASIAGGQCATRGTGWALTASGDGTVKVATDRLDSLINMVGELVIAQSMVSQDMAAMSAADQQLARNLAHLGKITRELQSLCMSMRMVPIRGVFQKMSRLVRDLSRQMGKEIEFDMAGGETELDRNLVDSIGDPLVHMVRNSADHGIETPEVRLKAGKARAGKIGLKAFHQGGDVVIEISDDGGGLNKQRILEKAIDAGVVKEGQDLTDQEIFRLVFHAGLSTAERITNVSGRGVGMDVVRKNIEALRGRIDISSAEGLGSTFTIRLPLTLAVIDGLVVRVGTERFILPITSVERSIQPKASQLSTVQNRGEMCMVRGAALPLFRLYRLFNVKPATEDPTGAIVVVVQDHQRRCCLLVDELLGQQQVVIKSLGEGVGAVPGVSGGAIMNDGKVSLILDPPGLIDLAASM